MAYSPGILKTNSKRKKNMRVIAGTARSLPLKTIEGLETRPTTDRIKETLFNMPRPGMFGEQNSDDCRQPRQGIEALSRGAESCTFVEQAKNAAACIEDNLKFTKLADKAQVRKFDAVSFVSSLPEIDYDVIFMDPPYSKGLERRVLEVLSQRNLRQIPDCGGSRIGRGRSYVDALGLQ